jgi:ketosteroid isomerase-like protein
VESADRVEIVRRLLEATNRGDFGEAMAAYADDIVLVVHDDVIPINAGTFAGRDAVGEWFADWFRSFARGYRFELLETQSVGEHLVAVVRHRGRGRSSGIAIDGCIAYLFSFAAGKVVRYEIYGTRAEALGAVGLEE